MTDKEKQRIIKLRNRGLGYGAIAMELGISKNVVSSILNLINHKIIFAKIVVISL